MANTSGIFDHLTIAERDALLARLDNSSQVIREEIRAADDIQRISDLASMGVDAHSLWIDVFAVGNPALAAQVRPRVDPFAL